MLSKKEIEILKKIELKGAIEKNHLNNLDIVESLIAKGLLLKIKHKYTMNKELLLLSERGKEYLRKYC